MTTNHSATDLSPVGGVLEHLDPNSLIIDTNVRTRVEIDSDFVASIADGVRQPVSGVRRADGTTVVYDGQRRVLAARAAGLPTVPVYVQPDNETDDTTRALGRITHQIVTNEHRANLTAGERADALAQMLDLGLSPTAAAKRVHIKRTEIRAAAAVAKAESARTAVDSGKLSLEQGAVLAEFENHPEIVSTLLRAAESGQFDHIAANARRELAERREREEAVVYHSKLGHEILDREPGQDSTAYVLSSRLVTPDGDPVTTSMTGSNPGVWAVYLALEEGVRCIDVATGAPIDRATVDWNASDDAGVSPRDGMRHANTVELQPAWMPQYYCSDLAVAGVVDQRQSVSESAPADDPTADTDRDGQRRAVMRREAADAAATAAKNQQTRALNTLARTAASIRIKFVRELLARRTPPKGAAAFIAQIVAVDGHLLGDFHAPERAADLLGTSAAGFSGNIAQLLSGASEQRAVVVLLGMVLGALEDRTVADAWKHQHKRGVPEYLRFLHSIGYPLSEIEEVVIGDRTIDNVALSVDQPLANAC